MKSHKVMDARRAYDIWLTCVDGDMQTAIALMLYILQKRGWHKDRLQKLFEDFVSELSHPIVFFGKEIDNEKLEKHIEKTVGVDLGRVKVNCADFDPKKCKF